MASCSYLSIYIYICIYIYTSILKISIKIKDLGMSLTHHILRGSEVLNPLQSGPECPPWDLELLILKECDGSK